MSESVKIGGIGKNPAIDKINSLNGIDIGNFAANRMKQLVLNEDSDSGTVQRRQIPLHLENMDWEGEAGEREREINGMAGNKLSGRQDTPKAAGGLREILKRSDGVEISHNSRPSGGLYRSGGESNLYVQSVGQALAGAAGISGHQGDTEDDEPHLSGKHTDRAERD